MRRSTFGLSILSSILLTLPGLAAEGRIPIPFTSPPTTPVVIGTPGRYIVTRNLLPTGPGPIIDVATPGPVEIDLNGFFLDNSGSIDPVIRVSVAGPGQLAVRNGSLRGGGTGIEAVPVGGSRNLIIEDVQISEATNDGIHLADVEDFVIRRCTIFGCVPGIRVEGGGALHQGIIEKNLLKRCKDGIVIINGKSISVLNNALQNISPGAFSAGIDLEGAFACLVNENTLEEMNGPAGTIGIKLVRTVGSKLFDNVITRAFLHGISLDLNSHDNLIWKNVVRECGSGGGHGIFIAGDRNHVEGNVANTNAGKGLVFLAGADNNVYRGNTARGNNTAAVACAGACGPGTDFCNAGAGNSSNGDNWLPVAPCT